MLPIKQDKELEWCDITLNLSLEILIIYFDTTSSFSVESLKLKIPVPSTHLHFKTKPITHIPLLFHCNYQGHFVKTIDYYGAHGHTGTTRLKRLLQLGYSSDKNGLPCTHLPINHKKIFQTKKQKAKRGKYKSPLPFDIFRT